MKSAIKGLLAKYTPLRIKKSLYNLWKDGDNEFWIHCKEVLCGNDDLFKERFLWTDLVLPIQTIENRFGKDQRIFLLTDRRDCPETLNLHLIAIEDLKDFKDNLTYTVICAYESDEKLLDAVRLIIGKPNIFYYCPFRYLPTARYINRNNVAKEILKSELSLNWGKFDLADFENIIQALEITRNKAGDYVEIGVYKGDSAHMALEYMKATGIKRNSYFFDLFDGFINRSSEQSNDAIWLNSHADTSLKFVEQFLQGFENSKIYKLDIITQELPSAITEIALCNIDVDMFEAVQSALKKVAPLIVRGGIIILEDQGHTPFLAGAFAATMEFIKSNDINFSPIHMTSGQMFLIKI